MLRRLGFIVLMLTTLFVPPAAADDDHSRAGANAHPSARAAGPYAFVAGRRDSNITVVDIGRALDPANAGNPNAILSEAKTAPDVNGAPRGDPANVMVSSDGRIAIAVNHAGNADQEAIAGFHHGWPATLAVLDTEKAMDPANTFTTNALLANFPTGAFGAVGIVMSKDGKHLVVSHAESDMKETGGREFSIIELATGKVVRIFRTAPGSGGRIQNEPGFSCAEMQAEPSRIPRGYPHPNVGCFTETNAIGVARGHLFTANGGTDEVGVINMGRLLAGRENAEVARIPVHYGPWGLDISPREDLVAVANRESGEFGQTDNTNAPREGRTISILDTRAAIADRPDAVLATVVVGTDDRNLEPPTENSATASRPFFPKFTPDGREILVTNYRTNSVSVVNVKRAVAGSPTAEVARIPLVRPLDSDGVQRPARPKGIAITSDGRYAVVTGGERNNLPDAGTLFVIDIRQRKQVAAVTGVGNDPYTVAITNGPVSG
ncbi:MAG: YncE family protein [Actinomadura sp.]